MATVLGQALHDRVDRLAAAYTAGGTALVLQSGQGAAYAAASATAPIYVRVEDELFRVTGRADDTLTVAGAQGGTSASDHAPQAAVEPVLTHVDWNAARGAILGLEALVIDPQSANTVLAGPTSGAATAPTLRALDYRDLPDALFARARNSANQSLTNGAFTAITWDTDVEDAADMHSTSGNTHLFFVPRAGLWLIAASKIVAANATGIRAVQLALSGGSAFYEKIVNPIADGINGTTLEAVACRRFAVNDAIYMAVYHNISGGGALDALGGASEHLGTFSLLWIGD
jgi:hypothetical protein